MANIADLGTPSAPDDKEVVVPASRDEWRRWLASNPEREDGLWVAYRKKSSGLDGPVYDDLVEEALCFGWIDSRMRRIDDDRVVQWFSPRRAGGIWSALNKERIERLIAADLMTDRGRSAIDAAKADGSWAALDAVEELVVPDDLAAALDAAPDALEAYEALRPSAKKQFLWWIHSAKRPGTRAARIDETVERLTSERADPDGG